MTHIQSYEKLFSDFEKWNNDGWQISNVEENLLQLYIGHFYSVYEIRTYLKSADPKSHKYVYRRIVNSTDYKNIHRRIKKLKKLQLIDECSSVKSNHGAKYYKLSEKGLFYIIIKVSSFIGEYLSVTQVFKLLHLNYPETFIFQLFLRPYLDIKTIVGIYGTVQINAFWRYLRSCCEAVQDITDLKEGGEQILIWSDVKPIETYKFKELKDKRLGEFLKKRFNLNWLDQADITKSENNSTLKIFNKNRSVTIELIDNSDIALLKINRKEKLELKVTIFRDEQNKPCVFDLCSTVESNEDTRRINIEGRLKMHGFKLVLELLSYPIIQNDINVLSQDKKFVRLLNQVKQEFNDRCNLINKTRL